MTEERCEFIGMQLQGFPVHGTQAFINLRMVNISKNLLTVFPQQLRLLLAMTD
jgi:hypothetical protein